MRSTVADLSRSKAELIAENMFLRQQVIVLERQVVRPVLRPRDRQVLVWLASWLSSWRDALMHQRSCLHIVKPDTLVDWHRQGFRLYWRRKSRVRQGRPPISSETIMLIEEMALNN